MTNPICGGPALPPDPSPLWSVPPGMVAPPLPRPDDAEAVEKIAHALFAYGWGNIRTWGEMTEKMREKIVTENDLRDCENEAIAALANVRSPYVKGLAQRVGQLAQSHRMLARAHADCPDADELARLRAVVDAGQGDGGSPSERQRRGVLGRKDGGHALSLRRLHHAAGSGGRPCAARRREQLQRSIITAQPIILFGRKV